MNELLLLEVIVTIPVLWGIYEFRQFGKQIYIYSKLLYSINSKISDISNNKLDKYPYLNDFKILINKINNHFNPKKDK